MSWVIGIREVRRVTVAVDEEQVGLRRGPVMTRQERVIVDLSPDTFGRTIMARGMVFLPVHTGAGPCGTSVRAVKLSHILHPMARVPGVVNAGSVLAWSIEHLLDPLAAYYATYEPPMRFGAKPGPRGRRVA